MPVDDDQVMTDLHAGSPRDTRARDGTAVGFAIVRPSCYVDVTEAPAVDGVVALGSRIGVTGGRDSVPRFGYLSCVVLSNTNASSG